MNPISLLFCEQCFYYFFKCSAKVTRVTGVTSSFVHLCHVYCVTPTPACTSAGPLSLEQDGVYAFVITSGCTDCPLRTQFTLVAEQGTAHFVHPRFAARAELHSSGRYLPVPGSGRKRRDPFASKPFVFLWRHDILYNFLNIMLARCC